MRWRFVDWLPIVGLLLAATAGATPSSLTRVVLAFDLKVDSPLPPSGFVVLREVAENARPEMRVSLEVGKEVAVSLPPGTRWEIRGTLAGFWLEGRTILVGNLSPTTERFAMWPLGRIAGTVRRPRGTLPQHVVVTTLAAPILRGPTAFPRGLINCPIDSKGAWSCELPATRYDLGVSVEGYVPQYLWGVQVPAGATVALGQYPLERGASVAGWVISPDAPLDPRHSRVGLTFASLTDDLTAADRARRTRREVAISAVGFFQFSGVAPGLYDLSAAQPGLAETRVGGILVQAATESFLREPLILHKPRVLDLNLEPPVDPFDRPWTLRVIRAGRPGPAFDAETLYDRVAPRSGEVQVAGATPGFYSIDVSDAGGQRVLAERIEILDPESARRTLRVAQVAIEGRVSLGGEPLPAELWFGGRKGRISVPFMTDTEGRFSGLLPDAPTWLVEIEANSPSVHVHREVRIPATRQTDGAKRIDLKIPANRLSGRVVDERGTPVEGSEVGLVGSDGSQVQRTGGEGTFEFRNFEAGPIEVSASFKRETFSDQVQLTVGEQDEVGPIELHLFPGKKLDFAVRDPGGPIAGALVFAAVLPSASLLGQTRTDAQGRATFRLPRDLEANILFVGAPGFALRSLPFEPSETVHDVLLAPESGGRLRLTLPEKARTGELVLEVFVDGHLIPLTVLRRWAQTQGIVATSIEDDLTFPSLAPGRYRACLRADENRAEPCSEGTLEAGADLNLPLEGPP